MTTYTKESCELLKLNIASSDELPEECKNILGYIAKTGVLARRKSSITRTWNEKDGHNSRSVVGDSSLVGYDIVNDSSKPAESAAAIHFESLSEEGKKKTKQLLARTASQGAKIRSGVEPSPADVHAELQRRESKKLERKNSKS
jgi:hypothetical protein